MSGDELEVLIQLVKFRDPAAIFEFGTFDGRTTLNLAANSRPDARVVTLDLPREDMHRTELRIDDAERRYVDKPRSGIRFLDTDVAHKIVQVYFDSAGMDVSDYREKFDFIFIDGSHTYDYVINDTRLAVQMLRVPGVLVWHDYVSEGDVCWPGLVKALERMNERCPAFRNLRHVEGTSLAVLQVDAPIPLTTLPPRSPWLLRWLRSVLRR